MHTHFVSFVVDYLNTDSFSLKCDAIYDMAFQNSPNFPGKEMDPRILTDWVGGSRGRGLVI